MSDKTTAVRIPGCPGWLSYGHVSRAAALEDARRHYEREARTAAAALAALERGDATVYHQRGIHRARDRVEVKP